jgi:hypothetical protein
MYCENSIEQERIPDINNIFTHLGCFKNTDEQNPTGTKIAIFINASLSKSILFTK